VLGAAVGTFELACWDLAGWRAGSLVWALAAPPAPRSSTATYATCFGIRAGDQRAPGIAAALSTTWDIQKWRAEGEPRFGDAVERLADAAGGDGAVALDFQGTWAIEPVKCLCELLSGTLAWAEEPYAPCDLHKASAGELGVPHAAGEHCYGPFEAAVLREARVDIWQPDAVFCGGYDNLRALAREAADAGALCAPHGGGFLAAVHAAAAGARVWLAEYHLLLEPRRQAHLRQSLLPQFADGVSEVAAPALPGWAGPLSEEVLRHVDV
jgi:L-alanine-DL-glutamate epimerase-like enolase superfamily enzyme